MKDITFKNLTDEQINAIKVLLGDAEIEEQVEEEKISFPKNGDVFYFLLSDGEIDNKYFSPTSPIDMDRLSIGNCFRTEEEAEFEIERLKVIHEMKKFAEPEDCEWNNCNNHYYIYYSFLDNTIRTGNCSCSKSNHIYFKSEEDDKACIKAVGEDRIKKYYFGIKEGEKE